MMKAAGVGVLGVCLVLGMSLTNGIGTKKADAAEIKPLVLKASIAGLSTTPIETEVAVEPALSKQELVDQKLNGLYGSIFNLEAEAPAFDVFKKAMVGYTNLLSEGKISNKNIITIIDFSLPSVEKRMWIVDLATQKILFHDWVAHGKNSGGNMATSFSNTPNSNQSSLGFYITANTYTGKHGLSLRLQGQEDGINHNAFKRAIVMHGADYVNEGIIKSVGRLGRSFGCPAVSMKIYKDVINTVANGSCMFIYHPQENYLTKSNLLREGDKTTDLLLATAF